MSSNSGLATRLYQGEAGINIVGRRRQWYTVAAVAIVVALISIAIQGFHLGIDFAGGNEFQVPSKVGTTQQVENAFKEAGAVVGSVQESRASQATEGLYRVRTAALPTGKGIEVRNSVAAKFGIDPQSISSSAVSAAWGRQITERAIYGLLIFIAVVAVYLVFRFEWRMAVAAVASLFLDLILTAGVYSLVKFEVTPSTVIGFLTILGFALYDVVVVFDKIQENTRGITASSTQTYADAANLAVNQTLMRSINTGLVALLPVGGLLFIGAGLLGAGTLKDLSLVLFVGTAFAVISSIFFATPVLIELKNREPRIKAHNARVRNRRAQAANVVAEARARGEEPPAVVPSGPTEAPKPGARPANRPGPKKGRPGRR